jgi:hypothetical protein
MLAHGGHAAIEIECRRSGAKSAFDPCRWSPRFEHLCPARAEHQVTMQTAL